DPRRGGGRRGRPNRASGAGCHRLHARAYAAPLHAPAVGLARRFWQRERLGGKARQPHRRQGLRWAVAHAGRTLRAPPMSTELEFDPIRLPPECQALRRQVRAFLAEEIEAGTFNPHEAGNDAAFSEEFSRKVGAKGWIGMTWPKKYGGGGGGVLAS